MAFASYLLRKPGIGENGKKRLSSMKGRGIETVSGIAMFVAQGTAQWEIWTGERAPVEAMRGAVLRALMREEKMDRR